MSTQPQALIKILYPLGLPQHLSDEEIARQLDESEKRSRAAKKRQARKQREAQQHD